MCESGEKTLTSLLFVTHPVIPKVSNDPLHFNLSQCLPDIPILCTSKDVEELMS